MIEEPPPLTIADEIDRTAAASLSAFRDAPTSFIVDALGGSGALDSDIRPRVGDSLIGLALTCDCGPRDNLALIAAVGCAEPGDVLVAATRGYRAAAVTGDLLLGAARNRGVAGFVTDGAVRDLADLEALGLPVYAAAVTPNSPTKRGPGTVGLPIVCGGVRVESGDIVVADRDGVVIVPRGKVAETLARLEGVRAAEAALSVKVREGLTDLGALVEERRRKT